MNLEDDMEITFRQYVETFEALKYLKSLDKRFITSVGKMLDCKNKMGEHRELERLGREISSNLGVEVSLEELREDASAIFDIVQRLGRPVSTTLEGKLKDVEELINDVSHRISGRICDLYKAGYPDVHVEEIDRIMREIYDEIWPFVNKYTLCGYIRDLASYSRRLEEGDSAL
jgi:hypothetical protein